MHTYFSKNTPYALLIALAAVVLWPGCDKGNEPDGPECNLSGATFTYNSNIKGIIDRRCISCHAAGSGVAGAETFDYRTYEGMKSHLDACHMRERVVIDKHMPPGGGGMTQAERSSINCWILAGYPKN